jgi:hypothetical protein
MFSNLEEIDDSYYMKEETFHNDWMMFYYLFVRSMFVTCLPNFSVILLVGDLLGCVRRYLLGLRVSIGNLHSDAAKEKGMTKKLKRAQRGRWLSKRSWIFGTLKCTMTGFSGLTPDTWNLKLPSQAAFAVKPCGLAIGINSVC